MSQVSQVQNAEPQAGEPKPANTVGTSPSELDQLRAERDLLKGQVAELEPLKGWQKTFVQAHQSGLADLVKEMTAQGKSPQAIKDEIKAMQEAAKTVREVGGVERIRTYQDAYEVLYGQGNPPSGAVPAAPAQQVQDPSVTREQLRSMVLEVVSERDISDLHSSFADDLSRAAGRVDASGNPDPGMSARFRVLLEDEVRRMTTDPTTGARRTVMPEDVGRATAVLERDVAAPMKAASAALLAPTNSNQIPPTVNARGPGGSEPAKPMSQMTREEMNALIEQRVRTDREARGVAAPTRARDTLPSNWRME